MAAEKKKIGLVLASIHTGISQNMWAGFVRAAALENTSLFIFPGGRLNARQDFENLRNSVYSLVNEENLDGCISWSSSIRYAMSKEEFELFHSGFDSLPYVTLGFKSPEHPCVEFDAYNGMKALVSHCINVHGGRKIAFLRGPDFHQSAQSRFEGYYDALKEAGAFHSPLVTDHFNWEAGEAAAVQLFEERGLIPGRDFDTLIGSSDIMTLGAVSYFAKRGYHVPGDYHAAGFNNSAESRVTESPLSTVLQQFRGKPCYGESPFNSAPSLCGDEQGSFQNSYGYYGTEKTQACRRCPSQFGTDHQGILRLRPSSGTPESRRNRKKDASPGIFS